VSDLHVDVRDGEFIVTAPALNESVTYWKSPKLPILMAPELMRRDDPDPSTLDFLVKAWKVAHKEAKASGWFNAQPFASKWAAST
jgi:hypothetical protein